jgi:poly(U)-specific endoribonuclease
LSPAYFQKGQIAKIRFTLNNLEKPTNSLFIGIKGLYNLPSLLSSALILCFFIKGTSPELELALYTVCFELRADQECRMAYGGKDFNIVTHSYRYRSKNMIGSAYPEI